MLINEAIKNIHGWVEAEEITSRIVCCEAFSWLLVDGVRGEES